MCNCLAVSDKTKKVIINNTILLDTCPDFKPQQPIESVLCSKCKTIYDIPVKLASLSPDEIRIISLVCPFLKVIILPGG